MQPNRTWHNIAVIFGILSLLFVTYATILVSNFKSPEAIANFFQKSNAYHYIAEIIKADIRDKYPTQLRNNVIELTIADTVLNEIITPSLVERISFPSLKIASRVNQFPLSLAENNVVINTKEYTQKFSDSLTSLQLPSPLTDTGKNLIASIPPQITIINTKENPNSILFLTTKAKVFFENLQKILTIAWIILLLSIAILVIVNKNFLKHMTRGFVWIFAVSGFVGLLASYAVPAIISSMYTNPDPVAGMLKDDLINSMVMYYFSLSRIASIIYLLIAVALYLIYRFAPFDTISHWPDQYLMPQENKSATTHSSRKKKSTKRTKK